jgi:hypothetical protein
MDAGVGLASLVIVGALVMVAVLFRVVVMWLYNGSGRSVLVVALFHSAYNSAWGTGDHRFTGELISGPAATLIPIAVVAVVLTVLSRGRLAYKPERGAATERGGRSGPSETATTNLLITARVPAQGDPIPPAEKGDSA